MHRSVLAVISLGVLTVVSATACGTAAGTAAAGATAGTAGTSGTATTTPAAAGALAPATGAHATTGAAATFTYRNARFGFSVAVPASFTAGTPPEDGDGMSFSPADHRITLTVYGSNNVLDDTAASAAASFAAQQKAKHGRVTLDSVSGDTYTVSGYDSTGTTIWYEHMIVESTVEYGIDWQYPAALASQVDPEVTATVRGYVPGPNHSA